MTKTKFIDHDTPCAVATNRTQSNDKKRLKAQFVYTLGHGDGDTVPALCIYAKTPYKPRGRSLKKYVVDAYVQRATLDSLDGTYDSDYTIDTTTVTSVTHKAEVDETELATLVVDAVQAVCSEVREMADDNDQAQADLDDVASELDEIGELFVDEIVGPDVLSRIE